jgi:hypothetical protein
MMVEPAATPVTTPVPAFTVAIAVLALLHMPPGVASENGVLNPIHTIGAPVTAAGSGLTVAVIVIAQPVGNL